MNKGLTLAKGNVIGFLHADDEFANELVLTDIYESFERNGDLSAIYGDLNYIYNNESSSIFRVWKSCSFTQDLLKKVDASHPTLYVRRECFKELKGFNTNYKISSDYDFILRLFSNENYMTHYIPKVLVNMSVGGASNKSFKNIIQKSLEDFNILRCNGSSIINSFITLFFKNVSKLINFYINLDRNNIHIVSNSVCKNLLFIFLVGLLHPTIRVFNLLVTHIPFRMHSLAFVANFLQWIKNHIKLTGK